MKLRTAIICLLAMVAMSASFSQLTANGAYLMGNQAEIGIHNQGFEGTSDIAGSHARSNQWDPLVFFGFVANPQNNAWAAFDGDFFTPGTPENGFGLTFNGLSYNNNAADVAFQNDINGTLSNYTINSNCISVDWMGAVAGVNVAQTYRFNSLNLFYVVDITLTNTTSTPINNLYFHRNIDPDNNVTLSNAYETQNTIVSQATLACPISLVSAEQTVPNNSYLGLAAVGQNFRVTYGGFGNRVAEDIWNFNGFTGALGSTNLGDEAISIAYKINSLAPGASESFQYAVVLSESQVSDAFAGLYEFAYPGSVGTSECNPVVDTVTTTCGTPVTISVNGPNASAYTWVWSPPAGLNTTAGPTVIASPSVTTVYTVTGTPTTCLTNTITKDIVVIASGLVIGDTSVTSNACTQFDLATFDLNQINSDPTSVITFHSAPPTSGTDMTNQYATNIILPGDPVYVLLTTPASTCYDIAQINIQFNPNSAGLDSTNTYCFGSAASLDLDNFLRSADPGGTWSETSGTASGLFVPSTGLLNSSTLSQGTYTFEYASLAVSPCVPDIAVFTIVINNGPYAGFDSTITLCANSGQTVNMNNLLNGNSSVGSWSYPASINAAVDAATGVLTNTGVATGSYPFTYTISATAPCVSDQAVMTVLITNLPVINPIADLSVCNGYTLPAIVGTNLSSSAAYYTGVGGTGTPFAPGAQVTNSGTYYAYNATGPLAACTAEEPFVLTVIDTVSVSFNSPNPIGCEPWIVNFVNTSPTALTNCVWDFGDGSTGTGNAASTHLYEEAGVYTVTLTGQNNIGCVGSTTMVNFVTIVPFPVASFTFTPGVVEATDPQVTFIDNSSGAVNWNWTFGNGGTSTLQNPQYLYPEQGNVGYEVELTVENYLGCSDSVSLSVFINDFVAFYVPNAFTPDGDEFNNTFKPVMSNGVDVNNYNITIFNRWGEVIFESNNPEIGWDGVYKNKLCPNGVYQWKMEFKETMSDKRHFYTGSFSLVR
jgi:gliding motility-associated-like protein